MFAGFPSCLFSVAASRIWISLLVSQPRWPNFLFRFAAGARSGLRAPVVFVCLPGFSPAPPDPDSSSGTARSARVRFCSPARAPPRFGTTQSPPGARLQLGFSHSSISVAARIFQKPPPVLALLVSLPPPTIFLFLPMDLLPRARSSFFTSFSGAVQRESVLRSSARPCYPHPV